MQAITSGLFADASFDEDRAVVGMTVALLGAFALSGLAMAFPGATTGVLAEVTYYLSGSATFTGGVAAGYTAIGAAALESTALAGAALAGAVAGGVIGLVAVAA